MAAHPAAKRKAVTVRSKNGRTKKGTPRKSVHYKDKRGRGMVLVGKGTTDMLEGKVDVSTWTDEELIRGAPMSTSHVPHVIPLVVHQELQKRVMSEARHRMAAELEYAIEKHIQIIKAIDPSQPSGPQVKALEMLYDRALGKPDEHITHTIDESPFMKALANAVVGTEEQAAKVLDITPKEKTDAGS